jgi:hypothetical protein
MTTKDRKAAIAAYKERKTVAGIYAVRCTASGQVWVGAAPNLDTIQNRIWFSLRHPNSTFRDLQAAWNEHGAESFTFQELERLDEDVNPLLRKDLLKQRSTHWQEFLSARPL